MPPEAALDTTLDTGADPVDPANDAPPSGEPADAELKAVDVPTDSALTPPAEPEAEPAADQAADDEAADESFLASLPPDWRDKTVAELELDEKQANMLGRLTDMGSLVKGYLQAQETIRKGEHKQVNALPENPTEEQLAEYRKEIGVPETPQDYELSLDDGLVLGEEDREVMAGVFAEAHNMNVPADQLSRLTNAMLRGQEAQIEAEMSQHAIDQHNATAQMKKVWGGDYQTNINAVSGFLATMPETVRSDFMNAVMPESGRKVFNSPEAMAWFADQAKTVNPAATVVGNSNNPVGTINDEIAKIEDVMQNDSDRYWGDQGLQKRYEELLDAQSRLKA